MNHDIITDQPGAQDPDPINRASRESVSSEQPPLLTNRERTNGAASVSERSSSVGAPTPSNRERSEPGPRPTGPRTTNGKLRSSINALKHGLRAAKPENAVPDDMRRTYEKMRAAYIAEYRPSGATESTLLDMVIHAAWQLYRIRQMELFAPIELATHLDSTSFGKSDRLARYRAGFERMFQSNLKQLKQIQQERLLLDVERECVLPAQIPPGVRLQPLFKHLAEIAWRPKARAATAALREREQSSLAKRSGDRNSSSLRP